MSRSITAENIGPVPRVVIDLPEGGGVVELLGRNGQGKSHLLSATERLLVVGKANLTNRDNTPRGMLEGLGIKLSVTRGGTRRTGELEVESIEHRLDLATFIDPQIDNAESADRKRIAALMALSGVTADATRFHRLCGGSERFAKLIDAKVEKMTDVVEIAKQVKADLERNARQLESQAEREMGEAAGASGAVEGLDMSAETDAEKLDAARDAAVAAQSRIKAQREAAEAAWNAAASAKHELAKAEQTDGPTLADAVTMLDDAATRQAHATSRVELTRAALEQAQRDHEQALAYESTSAGILKTAQERVESFKRLNASLDGWRRTIEAGNVTGPTSAEIDAAADAVAKARAACEMGTLVRAARRAQANAAKHLEKAGEHQRQAVALRDGAKATDDVLSELVAAPGLTVDGGRLVAKHPRRGPTLLAELSMGERTRIAMDLGAARVGKGGILVLPQEFWESLDPLNRQEVDAIAKGLGVTVITARAADGEIRSHVYDAAVAV